MDGMDDIVREFVVESYENLDQLDHDLVALEDQPGSRELLGSVFRTIHTIKGTSGFLAFGVLESLTHVGENLLAQLRDGKRPMTQRTTDVLLKMVDAVREILHTIEVTGSEGDSDWSSVVSDMQAVLDDPTGGPVATPASGAAPPVPGSGPATPAPIVAVKPVAEPDATRAATPAAKRKAPAKPRAKARSPRKSADRKASAAEPMPSPTLSAPVDPEETLEVSEPDVANALHEVGAGSPAPARTDDAPARSAADASIRVDVEVLDALMRHVGELVLARNAMTRLATDLGDASLVRASQRLSLIATELQQGVMKTRMQPIEHVWSKVPRMVRDISAALERHVRLEMIGQDTELDRGLLEAIKDPLTHLIRNAIDHGIEAPAARRAVGKADQGVLTLRAFHQGGQVVVEIGDDGKGIDPKAIAAKALERGLRTQAQVAAMSTQDILNLLFLPGFSTAETVTNVSGRGVGMDVVRTKVEAIGGVVDVQSTPGLGTTWRLRIPLTLAIMPALTVRCYGETYAVPQVNLRCPPCGNRPPTGRQLCSNRPQRLRSSPSLLKQ